jgi:hypothetical protein
MSKKPKQTEAREYCEWHVCMLCQNEHRHHRRGGMSSNCPFHPSACSCDLRAVAKDSAGSLSESQPVDGGVENKEEP